MGWHENGRKQLEALHKDGKLDGLLTIWYENGQKKLEETRKDGKLDGPWNRWHESGQKQVEATYKDGEEVSAMYWNSEGKWARNYTDSKK